MWGDLLPIHFGRYHDTGVVAEQDIALQHHPVLMAVTFLWLGRPLPEKLRQADLSGRQRVQGTAIFCTSAKRLTQGEAPRMAGGRACAARRASS